MRIETGRVCAVCGKTTSPVGHKDTYGFKTILARNGILGDKAHRDCISSLANADTRVRINQDHTPARI